MNAHTSAGNQEYTLDRNKCNVEHINVLGNNFIYNFETISTTTKIIKFIKGYFSVITFMKLILLNTLHMILKSDLKMTNSLCKSLLYLAGQDSRKDQSPAWIFTLFPLPPYKDSPQQAHGKGQEIHSRKD